ncbi:MAG: DUF1566 domain-containing protein [Deltaproteobacteria bacterium]|nr:DUF1566 domain-containing protein [Deltaproteobacteria bacterium]
MGGDDVICGGDGIDVIGAGSGNDIVLGENGHDAIWGGPGNDTLRGGDGNDSIYGGPGNDSLHGNHGNDSLYGISGVDELYGGWGPNSGSIDNNDTCYDTAGTLTKGCEAFNGIYMQRDPAPVPKTGQTQSYAPGDDGDLQMGVQWPNPRFTDINDGTVKDHLTGLIWLKNADCFGERDWWEALLVSNNLADGQCGLNDGSSPGDWHLPNLKELQSLMDYGKFNTLPAGQHFQNVSGESYWSSTSHLGGRTAWKIQAIGRVSAGDKPHKFQNHVWPVRGGND